MKKITYYYRKINITFLKVSVAALIVSAFFLPSFVAFQKTGDNIFYITINGIEVGTVGDSTSAADFMQEARKQVALDSSELVFIDADLEVTGKEVFWGKIDSKEQVIESMKEVLKDNVKETMQRSYCLKVNEYLVNLSCADEVLTLLNSAIDKYDSREQFEAKLVVDPERELNVLTTSIEESQDTSANLTGMGKLVLPEAGIFAAVTEMFETASPDVEKGFEDFDLGLKTIAFGDEVEVVEAYLPKSQITTLEEATNAVTVEQEKNTVYEVVAGDTLSGISLSTGIPMERLIELNETLENENSLIRIGDELTITIPEPELSVERTEECYYEEEYEAEVIYVDNDSWYTTQTKTLQEPSAGFRKVVASISYRNDIEQSREILKEEIVMEAVPKIVERGTIVPPTYIKPVSGGRLSSTFGRRKAPTKGASTYHKGIDWAVPKGTAVMASSSGTVAKAGWGSGYGYVVYINHPDGKQTRYAHLSKVLVSVGQSVTQGQKIALSGNTGISSGPHVHFEILVGGKQVNPLQYLD